MPFNTKSFDKKYRRWWWTWMRRDVAKLLFRQEAYIIWLEERVARLIHDLSIAEQKYKYTQVRTKPLEFGDEND